MLGCLDAYLKTRAQSISVHIFSGRVFFGFSAPRTTAEKARSKEAGSLLVSCSRAASRMRFARCASVNIVFLAGIIVRAPTAEGDCVVDAPSGIRVDDISKRQPRGNDR
jgi:hypothetical protein